MDIKRFVSISLSEDEMYAYLELNGELDGVEISSSTLLSLLNAAGVKEGIDMRELTEISLAPARYTGKKMTVAIGKKPVKGEDGYIIYHFIEKKKRTEEEIEEAWKIDFKEVTKLDNVKEGELLAEIVPPKEGQPGISVKGSLVMPRAGRVARFKPGKNVVKSSDGTKLYAAIDGLVTKTGSDVINVFPVYEVNGDVDYRTGNVNFNGTIVVRGSVLTGFKVTAAGDIRIIGTVDGAHLLAGGSIQVTEGIVGQNKGMVKAGADVKSSFIQDAKIEAGGDIVATQSIMHSQLSAGKHIICQGGNGLIVGGILQAGEKVHARTIGNQMATQTTVEVGVLPAVRKEFDELRKQLKDHMLNYDKTDKALTLLEQLAAAGKLDEAKAAMRQKLSATKSHIEEEMQQIKERTQELENVLGNSQLASVEVDHSVFPGTKIVIGRKVKFVKDAVRRVKFYLSEGDIAMRTKW